MHYDFLDMLLAFCSGGILIPFGLYSLYASFASNAPPGD